jgi:hypothetical protein
MIECSIKLGCHIQFQGTMILAVRSRCMEHIIREVIEIKLHPNNVNTEDFSLRK